MFRQVYLKLMLLMTLTVVVLLGSLDVMTYVVFRVHMERFGEANLRTQATEARDTLDELNVSALVGTHTVHTSTAFTDDTGQDVYFMVVTKQGVVKVSPTLPVPAKDMLRLARPEGYTIIDYAGLPFRVYALQSSVHGVNVSLYVYQLIAREVRTLRDVATALWTAGGIGAVVVVLLNVWLARRALEPARQTWKAQQDMMLELSHEIRTPLATIAAIATSLPGDSHRLIRETQHASALVTEILYFAQLQSMADQSLEPVAVSDITEETIGRLEPLAIANAMTIEGFADSGVYVLCTIERWSHLVSILFKNATEHGKPGSTIHWQLTANRDSVTFVIENEVAVDNHTGRDAIIHGIGLRIANRLVKDMRGRIDQTEENRRVKTTVIVSRCHR